MGAVRRKVKIIVAAASVATGLLATTAANAEPLSPEDRARLLRGETLVFEKTVVNDTRRYIGGVTYTVIDASPEELSRLLEDTSAYRHLLPRTKEARLVVPPGKPEPSTAHGRPREFFVELRQGNAVMETVYTLHVRKVPEANTVQFWMDPRMPHGIDDAWGFFRYEPLTDAGALARGVLFTYAVLVDVGPGIVRELFEERVRTVLLSVPQLVRSYVATTMRAPKQPAIPKKT